MSDEAPETTEAAPPPKRGSMRFRRASDTPRLSPDGAKRQGAISTLAFQLLGRDQAIAFLNTAHAELGGRPLDLATESAEGAAGVQAELERMRGAMSGSQR